MLRYIFHVFLWQGLNKPITKFEHAVTLLFLSSEMVVIWAVIYALSLLHKGILGIGASILFSLNMLSGGVCAEMNLRNSFFSWEFYLLNKMTIPFIGFLYILLNRKKITKYMEEDKQD